MPVNDILARADLEAHCKLFEAQVKRAGPNDCWPWEGQIEDAGYGWFSAAGVTDRAHRWAYVFSKGPIGRYSERRSLSICHKCDNRICCNPAHLFEGTDADNAADMVAKGRSVKGEEHHAAKLTSDLVRAIRRDPRSHRQTGETYDISAGTVAALRQYETWAHVDPDKKNDYDRHRALHAQPPTYGGAKLYREQVLEIRADARPVVEIAVEYDVTVATIQAVKAKRVWASLPGEVVKSRRKETISGDDRKRKITREIRDAVLASEDLPAVLAEQYGISRSAISIIRSGGAGKLGQLRAALKLLTETREEMDEGWFVPTATMDKIDEMK